MNIQEMLIKRAGLLDEAAEIVDRAKVANRSLTDSEKAMADKLMDEVDLLSREIKLAEGREGYTGPTKPEGGPAPHLRNGYAEERSATGIELRSDQTFASLAGKNDGPDLGLILRGMAGLGGAEARDAISGLSGAAGEVLIPSYVSAAILDRAMEQSALVRAGATRVKMLARTHTLPRISADPVLGWRAELGTVAESKEPGIDAAELVAKSVAGVAVVSMEALEDAVGLKSAVSASLSRAVARAIDAAALAESNVTNGPATLFLDGNIATATVDWTPAWADLADIAAELADAEGGELEWLIVPHSDIATLRKTQASTAGSWLGPVPGLENVRLIGSAAVDAASANVLAGSGARSIAIGAMSEVRIEVLRERYAVSQSYTIGTGTGNIGGAVGFLVWARVDVKAIDPQRLLLVARAGG